MKLFCTNTSRGLIPNYDSDFDEKKKLKIGETYSVEIKKPRNIQFHRLYFALINCAWEYQNEGRQKFFKNNIEIFRKTVEIAAGHCEVVYSIKLSDWVEVPKSISFTSMDELEFKELYSRIKDVLFATFLTHISQKEFDENLVNF